MAYGLRIRLEHHDFLNKLSRIDISERDYVGDYIERELDGPQPMQITWGDQSNPLPCIYGSEAIIRFLAENDLEFLFLFTSDARKYKVEHTYDGTLDWSGFIAPGNWNEPLIAPSYIVEATAVDGLGNLKNEVYPTPPESEVSKTMLQIIATILAQTGLSLNINTCVDWKETAQTAGTDPLAIHKLKTQHRAGQNSYELLEKLLPKCRIMQRLGQWWILSYNAMQADTITYFRYNSAGEALTPATATISVKAADYWIEGEPQLEIIQAIKQQIAVQDYGYNDNLAANGNFAKYNHDTSTFENWTNVGITPIQRDLDTDGNKFLYIPGQEYPDTLENFGFGLMTKCIRKEIKIVQSYSMFRVAFEYALMGSSYSCPMFVRIRIVGDTETWFLRLYPYTAATDPVFSWKKQTVSMAQGEDRISIASSRKKTSKSNEYIDGVWTNVSGKYYNTYDYVKAWPYPAIRDHFAKFEASTLGVPIGGTLEISLYVPFTNRAQISGAAYHSFKIEILEQSANQYPSQTSFKVINDLNNTHWPDSDTYEIGDYPDFANSELIYLNGISRADNAKTTAWQLAGSTSQYSFVEMLARLGVAIEQHPRQQYNIRLQYITPTLGIIIDDLSGQYLRLIENGITYDNRMGAVEGNYIQLPDINIDTFDVEVATEFDENTGQPAQGSTATPSTQTPVNSEKSVQIVDNEGVITSQPGYLDGEYFTDTFNEETGYTVIKPNIGIMVIYADHGFVVGDNIKATTTGWTKAQGDSKANAQCVGKVCQVIDENMFRYITSGLLPGSFASGTRYYLSTATPGADMAEPASWTTGQYRQYIGTGTTGGLMVEIDEGEEVTAASAVSDAAYNATTWDGVTDIAPSKNAVRDKIELIMSLFSGYAQGGWFEFVASVTTSVTNGFQVGWATSARMGFLFEFTLRDNNDALVATGVYHGAYSNNDTPKGVLTPIITFSSGYVSSIVLTESGSYIRLSFTFNSLPAGYKLKGSYTKTG